jgi:DnaJ-domain-containing protein 1
MSTQVFDLNYYRLLGVSKDDTAAHIKARYLVLAKKYHPDNGGDDNIMSLMNEAYAVLSDPEDRKRYDRMLASGKSFANEETDDYETPAKTNPRPRHDVQMPSESQVRAFVVLQAQIQKTQWHIKHKTGYVLATIFGFLVLAAVYPAPYVDHLGWTFVTIIAVLVFGYLYQKTLELMIKRLKNKADQVLL